MHAVVLNAIPLAVRFVILVFSGHKQVALENAALRRQLPAEARCEAARNCVLETDYPQCYDLP